MRILLLITVLAAFVNGGLGYGCLSITVPVALFYHKNCVMNPVFVLVEIRANLYTCPAAKALREIDIVPIPFGLVPSAIMGLMSRHFQGRFSAMVLKSEGLEKEGFKAAIELTCMVALSIAGIYS